MRVCGDKGGSGGGAHNVAYAGGGNETRRACHIGGGGISSGGGSDARGVENEACRRLEADVGDSPEVWCQWCGGRGREDGAEVGGRGDFALGMLGLCFVVV